MTETILVRADGTVCCQTWDLPHDDVVRLFEGVMLPGETLTVETF